MACGLAEKEWLQALTIACKLGRNERGRSGIPTWMAQKNTTQREHAILLCRVEGLCNAAKSAASACLGGSCSTAAISEMNRLLALDDVGIDEECTDASGQAVYLRGVNMSPRDEERAAIPLKAASKVFTYTANEVFTLIYYE